MTGIVIHDVIPIIIPDDIDDPREPSPEDKDYRIHKETSDPALCIENWLCYADTEGEARPCMRETCPDWKVCGKKRLHHELIHDIYHGEVTTIRHADDMINNLVHHRAEIVRAKDFNLQQVESEDDRREIEQLQPLAGYEYSLLLERFPGLERVYRHGKTDEQIKSDDACAFELFDQRNEWEHKQFAYNAIVKRSWESTFQEGCSRWYTMREDHEREWEEVMRHRLGTGTWRSRSDTLLPG
jgi:hypothetical protein